MKKRFRIYLVALLSLLLTLGSNIPVFADETGPKVIPTYSEAKNYPVISGYSAFKIDPNDGSYNNDTLTIRITDGGTRVTWSSTIKVSYVYVKGGDGGYLYDYTTIGGAFSDSGLLSPLNGGGNVPRISHLVFYYDPNQPPIPPTGTVTVTKIMSGGSSSAEGITFSLVQNSVAKYSHEITASDLQTDGSWQVVFTGVAFGTYTLVESNNPTNYICGLNSSNNAVVIDSDHVDVSKTVTNTYNPPIPPTGTVTVTKIMSGGNSSAAGITFSLMQDGTAKYTHTIAASDLQTDGSWQVVFTGVAFGTYTLAESNNPTNYICGLNSSNNAVVIDSDHVDVSKTVTNTYNPPIPPTGTVTVTKIMSGGNSTAAGITFSLMQDGTAKYSHEITASDLQTDGSWQVVFTGVAFGTYTLVESNNPTNYICGLNSSNNAVVIDSDHVDVSKTVTNTYNPPIPPTGTVTVTKIMSGGNSTAAGITFSLMQDGTAKYSHEITADDYDQANGNWKVVFYEVALGSYVLVESGTPSNYVSDLVSPENVITIDSDHLRVEKTVTNTYTAPPPPVITTGTVAITKIMSGGSSTAEGITFSLVQDGAAKYTHTIAASDIQTDGSWKVVFTGVALGNYTLVESGSPDGYTCDLNSSNNAVTIDSDHLNVSKTVTNTYSQTVPTEPVPGGGTVVIDEPIPGGPSTLPKTGEIPPEIFYGIGIALTAIGILLKKKK